MTKSDVQQKINQIFNTFVYVHSGDASDINYNLPDWNIVDIWNDYCEKGQICETIER